MPKYEFTSETKMHDVNKVAPATNYYIVLEQHTRYHKVYAPSNTTDDCVIALLKGRKCLDIVYKEDIEFVVIDTDTDE